MTFRITSLTAGCLLSALSGLLLTASMPTLDWWLLAWIAFVPALIVLYDARHQRNMRHTYLLGGLFGFVSGVGKVYWITETVMSYGGLDIVLGLLCTAIVGLLLGAYVFLFCVYIVRARWTGPLFPIMAASLWTGLEYLQTYVFTGFPWELLGYTQYTVLPVIQIARITGVYGISFLVALVNVTIAVMLVSARDGLPWRAPVYAMGVTCVLLIGVAGYGWRNLKRVHELERQTPPAQVAVIQGNIEQGMKWSESRLQKTIDIYAELTRSTRTLNPDLIVFPETAMTFYLESPAYKPFADQVHQLSQEMNIPLLTGALGYHAGEEGVYNTAFLIQPGQGITHRYSKIHLVPFGEYLPMPSIFFWLGGLTQGIGNLTPGTELTVMPLPGLDMRLGTVICYESIFPDLVRQFALQGANTLVVMTNDAWFGTSSAPMQHFSMGVLRAVENGLPVIRAANTGISGFISSTGQTYGMTPLLATTTTTARVYPGRDAPTLYTLYGDVFAMLCCLAGVAGVVMARR